MLYPGMHTIYSPSSYRIYQYVKYMTHRTFDNIRRNNKKDHHNITYGARYQE